MLRTLTVICVLSLLLGFACAQANTAPPSADLRQQMVDFVQRGNVEQLKALLAKHPELLNTPNIKQILLTVAVGAGRPAMVQYLIAKGADVKAKATGGPTLYARFQLFCVDDNETLLHTAARGGRKDMIALLLDLGLEVNARTANMKVTPLLTCCANGYLADPARREAIEYLLAHGADLNAAAVLPAQYIPAGFEEMTRLPGFGTPMMFTAKEEGGKELEALLLRYRAELPPAESRAAFQRYFQLAPCLQNLQAVGHGGRQWADLHRNLMPNADTVWQDLAAARLVQSRNLRCGARRGVENACGYNVALSGFDISQVKDPASVLVFADCRSQDNMIRSLDDIDAERHDGGFIAVFLDWHVAYVRAEELNTIVLKPEVAPPPPRDEVPIPLQLMETIGHGDLARVKSILAQHPELLNQSLGDAHTATPLAVAARTNRTEVMKYLIAQGADLHPDCRLTLMHYAVMGGKEAISLLADKGVDVNAPIEDYRETPLHYACMRGAQGVAAAECLLAHGANPNAAMGYSQQFFPAEMQACEKLPGFGTPLMWAALLPDCAPLEVLLLKYHATPLPPASREAFRKAYAPYAHRNDIRSIIICWQLLIQKGGEVMPKADTVWQQIATLMPQDMNQSFNPAWKTTFGYNVALSGLKMGQVKDASKMVVFADCTSQNGFIHSLADLDTTRNHGQCLVAFMDGHVQYIPAAEVGKLILKP